MAITERREKIPNGPKLAKLPADDESLNGQTFFMWTGPAISPGLTGSPFNYLKHTPREMKKKESPTITPIWQQFYRAKEHNDDAKQFAFCSFGIDP